MSRYIIVAILILYLAFIAYSRDLDIYLSKVDNYEENKLKEYKDKITKNIMDRENKHLCIYGFLVFRPMDASDTPDKFFCDKYIDIITDLPIEGKADIIPWSGSYWPIRFGGISLRYGLNENNTLGEFDPDSGELSSLYTWKESVDKYKQPDEHNIHYNSSIFEEYVNNNYSPAEKYDLLIGDFNYTLTNIMKKEGYYMEKDNEGDVPGWMGYCHGWSPASYIEKKPIRSVTITAADGHTKITFLPDDIKSYATVYWAEAEQKTNFIGNRCSYKNTKDIPSDKDTGLWDDYACFAINPASFHITMANQIGINKKNLVYDPNTGGDIWNQPVYGYKFLFYNVLNNNTSSDLKESLVTLEDIHKPITHDDKFLNYIIKKAQENTKYIIGVESNIEYIFESFPIHNNSEMEDNKKSLDYRYILELDESYRIIGGEWTDNAHPIFIWKIDEHEINSHEKENIFDGSVDSLRKLKKYAIDTSKNQKNVLKIIVNYLIEQSSK